MHTCNTSVNQYCTCVYITALATSFRPYPSTGRAHILATARSSSAHLSPPVLTPTLTLDKVTVNGDSSFGFTATGGFNQSLTGAAAPLLVSSSAGVYTITETVSAAQTTAGWTFTSVDCTGNALAETPSGSSVTVTVGANEDVTCTFTNSRTAQAQLGGNPTPIPTPVVRAATLASALPNTAMELPTAGISVGLLGLVTLLGLGYVARRNMIGIRNRR